MVKWTNDKKKEKPENKPQMYMEILYATQIEAALQIPGERKSYSMSEKLHIHLEKTEIGSFPRIINDISPRWIKALNMKGKSFKLIDENMREYLYDLKTGKSFFNKIKGINHKRNIHKFNYIKTKLFSVKTSQRK